MNKLSLLCVITASIVFVSADVQCPADQGDDGDAVYYPHETECGKFYECVAGKPTLFLCPAGLYFDASEDVCDWNVNCGKLITSTKAPSTDEPEPTDAPEPTEGPKPTDEPEPTEGPEPTEAPES